MPNMVWFAKNDAQWLQKNMGILFSFFLEVIPKKRSSWENICTKSGPIVFQASLGKFRPKSFTPPKFCLFLHLWFNPFVFTSSGMLPEYAKVNKRLAVKCKEPYASVMTYCILEQSSDLHFYVAPLLQFEASKVGFTYKISQKLASI